MWSSAAKRLSVGSGSRKRRTGIAGMLGLGPRIDAGAASFITSPF
jgi:hypothetical protein